MPENWFIAKLSSPKNGAVVFRYVKLPPAILAARMLPEQVSVFWDYRGQFPDAETIKKMDEFQSAMLDLSWGEDSRLVLVITGGGLREYCFHAADYDRFMKNLNQALANRPPYPLRIVHSHDPDWIHWHHYIDPLEAKAMTQTAAVEIEPNQSPQSTTPSVTPPAGQEARQP